MWSDDEERVFWDIIVPQSPNAANPADRNVSWKECAALMQRTLGAAARRDYTPTMLCRHSATWLLFLLTRIDEHHYQNWKPGPKTPRAHRFMAKYIRDCGVFWYLLLPDSRLTFVIEWYKTHTSPPPSPSTATAPAATAPAPVNQATQPTFTSAPAKVAIPRLRPFAQGTTEQGSLFFDPTTGHPNMTDSFISNREHQRRSLPTIAQPASQTYITNTPISPYWSSQTPMGLQQEATIAARQVHLTPSSRRGPLPIDPALRSGVVINHIMSSSEHDIGEPIPVLQYFVSNTGELRSSSAPSRASTESTSDSLASESTRTTSNDCRTPASSSAAGNDYARVTDRGHPLSIAARYSGSGSEYASIQGKRKRSETETPEEERPTTRPFQFMAGGRSLLNESESEAASTLQNLSGAAYQYPTQQVPQSSEPDDEVQQEHRVDVSKNEP